jgi:hypothetical protein
MVREALEKSVTGTAPLVSFQMEPGVDVAEKDFTVPRHFVGVRDVVENPADLAGGKVGVDNQAGFAFHDRALRGAGEFFAEIGGAAAFPDDSWRYGHAGFTIPDDGGFALVGDATGGYAGWLRARFGEGSTAGGQLSFPDGKSILLDPAGMGVNTGEGRGLKRDPFALGVVNRRARDGGSFVEREHERHLWKFTR